MNRIPCLLLLVLLVGCNRTTSVTMLAPKQFDPRPRTTTVEAVAFSPDGKSLLVGYKVFGKHEIYPKEDKFVSLWDVETGKEIREFKGHSDRVLYLTFLPDGKRALTASTDRSLKLWEVATGLEIRMLGKLNDAGGVAALSVDGKRALSVDAGYIRLWNVDSGVQIKKFEKPDGTIASLGFSPDSRLVISGDHALEQKSIRIWDAESGKVLHRLDATGTFQWAGTFSPDGKYLLTQRKWNQPSDHVDLVLWDTKNWTEIRKFEKYRSDVTFAAFTPDGRHIFCAAGGDLINMWEVETGKEVWYTVHPVEKAALSADGKLAVTTTQRVGYPGRHPHEGVRLDLWEVKSGKHLKTLTWPNP